MKKIFRMIILSIILLLSSCSTDEFNLEVNIETNNVESIYIEYLSNNNEEFKYYSDNDNMILDTYKFLTSFKTDYNKRETDVSKYKAKAMIYFRMDNNEVYDVKAYIYNERKVDFYLNNYIKRGKYNFEKQFLEFINSKKEYLIKIE